MSKRKVQTIVFQLEADLVKELEKYAALEKRHRSRIVAEAVWKELMWKQIEEDLQQPQTVNLVKTPDGERTMLTADADYREKFFEEFGKWIPVPKFY